MFCLHCGTDIPDVAQFCRKCGQSQIVASPSGGAAAAVAPARVAEAPAARVAVPRSRLSRIPLFLAVLFVVGLAGWWGTRMSNPAINPLPSSQPEPQLHRQTMSDGAFTVPAGAYHYVKFTAPEGVTNVKIQGHFSATGGMGNDVEVWVITEDGFANWQNGHAANTFYNSGRVTQDTLNVSLPGGGTYYLIFNNKFSFLTPKAVQANMSMTFYAR